MKAFETVKKNSFAFICAAIACATAIVALETGLGVQQSFDLNIASGMSVVASVCGAALFFAEILKQRTRTQRRNGASSNNREVATGLELLPVFDSNVDAARTSGKPWVVALLSVDCFPEVVATPRVCGAIRKELGLRLRDMTRPGDVVTALPEGGYGALLQIDADTDLDVFCAALVSACSDPVSLGVRSFTLRPRLGVVDLRNGSYEYVEQVMQAARAALRFADAPSNGGYYIHQSSHRALATDPNDLAQKLPRAIHDGLLEVYLQPRIALKGTRVLGFEALARWSSAGDQFSATELIEAAERAGTVIDLDRFILNEAVRLVANWNRHRKTCFALSVNLSASHFRSANGTEFIRDAIERHQFPADLLTIEISHTELLEDRGHLQPALNFLHELGCRFSIDDFGAGHSTLADLRSLPADEIKIDRRLVGDIEASAEARAIVHALLEMARKLKIDLVAEGVERDAQVDTLVQLGCARAQGYLFGRPRPATEWLSDATYGDVKEVAIKN